MAIASLLIRKAFSGLWASLLVWRFWAIGAVAVTAVYWYQANMHETNGYQRARYEIQQKEIIKQRELDNVEDKAGREARKCINSIGVIECMRRDASD
jgi:hypothetical protein